MAQERALTFGLPRMHKERGEKRDFLPDLVRRVVELGAEVYVESGIGSGMGLTDADYAAVSPKVHVVDNAEAFRQDVVLVLRFPEPDELTKLKAGSTLISMIHFPTRPRRIRRLSELGLEAISLDSLEDDEGIRLVENMRAVGWNGVEAAFDALAKTYPQLTDPRRTPISVTVMGAGLVGKHAVEAATKYGSEARNAEFAQLGLPGVEVTVLGRNMTGSWSYLRERFMRTDVLVDATQRSDPTQPLIPNDWLAWLPWHAVVCDLVVDPYVLDVVPRTVRSLEGIPRGDLDQWIFTPDDPNWDRTVPKEIPSTHRRTTVSCYSGPGVHPKDCMEHYGKQLAPVLETLLSRGGMQGIRRDGTFLERSLWRASLRAWAPGGEAEPAVVEEQE